MYYQSHDEQQQNAHEQVLDDVRVVDHPVQVRWGRPAALLWKGCRASGKRLRAGGGSERGGGLGIGAHGAAPAGRAGLAEAGLPPPPCFLLLQAQNGDLALENRGPRAFVVEASANMLKRGPAGLRSNFIRAGLALVASVGDRLPRCALHLLPA